MQMEERNGEIVAFFKAGNSVRMTASRFKLGRQRVYQILFKAGACEPYSKSARTKFLGVHVSEDTKDALKEKATEKGVSVSKLASDMLDEAVTE